MNKLPTPKLNPIHCGALPGKRHREQAGFTIIESLAAMSIVFAMLAGITPMLAIAVATRIQARQVELGAQAARSYIDHLRTGQLDHPTVSKTVELKDAPAPTTGSLSCPANGAYCGPTTDLYCVDGDGDGKCTTDSITDMIVQGVGFNAFSTDEKQGYSLLVRVYRAGAFKGGSLTTDKMQSIITDGQDPGNRKAPLAIITTEISGTGSNSYKDIRCRLNPTDPYCQ